MKLTTNRIRDNVGSLEEGLVVNEKNNDCGDIKQIERSDDCKSCVLFTKVMFYVLLVLFIAFISWVGIMYFTSTSKTRAGIAYGSPREIERADFDSGSAEGILSSSTPDDLTTSTQEYEAIPRENEAIPREYEAIPRKYEATPREYEAPIPIIPWAIRPHPDSTTDDDYLIRKNVQTSEDMPEYIPISIERKKAATTTERINKYTEQTKQENREFSNAETTVMSIDSPKQLTVITKEEMEAFSSIEKAFEKMRELRLTDREEPEPSSRDPTPEKPVINVGTSTPHPESATQEEIVQEIDTSSSSIVDRTEEAKVQDYEEPWDADLRERTTLKPWIVKTDRWDYYDSDEYAYDNYEGSAEEHMADTEVMKAVTESEEPDKKRVAKTDSPTDEIIVSKYASVEPDKEQIVQEIETSTSSIVDRTEEAKVQYKDDSRDADQAYRKWFDVFGDTDLREQTTPKPLTTKTDRWGPYDSDLYLDDPFDDSTEDRTADTEVMKAVTESVEAEKKLDVKPDSSTDPIVVFKDERVVPDEEATSTEASTPYSETVKENGPDLRISNREFSDPSNVETTEAPRRDVTKNPIPPALVLRLGAFHRKPICTCTQEPAFRRYPRGRVPFMPMMGMRTVCKCDNDPVEDQSDSEKQSKLIAPVKHTPIRPSLPVQQVWPESSTSSSARQNVNVALRT